VKISSDLNPIFITPPSGTINSGGIAGLAHARRCIPGVKCSAVWDGANWFVTRVLALPIGCLIDFWGTVLPAGYEWPNGQVLSSAANYPEYNSKMGTLTTPDMRGFVTAVLDNLGGVAAGRLPSGLIAQNTLGAVGGADVATAPLPAHFHSAGIYDPNHAHTTNAVAGATTTGGGAFPAGATSAATINAAATGVRVNSSNGLDTTYSTGPGGVHTNLQPTVMMAKLLVVE
jgi:hypothetical protein